MSAHAPGPWTFSEGWRGIYDADDRAVVVVCGPAVVRTDEQREWQRISEANARLIAAAPDLLAALRLWDTGCKVNNSVPGACHYCGCITRTAIAKAEGK